jgi:phosphoglycolate phosphatase
MKMTSNKKIKAVIFDLDGTLVDTVGDLAGAMNYALRLNNRPTRTLEECAAMIGNGVRKFAERALGSEHLHMTEKVMSEMMEYYLDHCTEKTAIYDGMAELVESLIKQGVSIAVLTNKDHPAAVAIINHYFPSKFKYVIGSTNGGTVKPEPDTLLGLLNEMDVTPSETIMVGDSQPDIQVGIAAGVKPVGVMWGFRSEVELRQAGAEVIVNRPVEILRINTNNY